MRWYFSPLHSWECPFVPWKADIFLCHNEMMRQGGRCLSNESVSRPARSAGRVIDCCFSGLSNEGVSVSDAHSCPLAAPCWLAHHIGNGPGIPQGQNLEGLDANEKDFQRKSSLKLHNRLFVCPLMWQKVLRWGFLLLLFLFFLLPNSVWFKFKRVMTTQLNFWNAVLEAGGCFRFCLDLLPFLIHIFFQWLSCTQNFLCQNHC